MNASTEPQLAPPGAGLPGPELQVARLLFLYRRLTNDRHSFTARFQQERETIRRLVNACPPEARGRRVLIERVRVWRTAAATGRCG